MKTLLAFLALTLPVVAQTVNGVPNQNVVASVPYMAGAGSVNVTTGCPTPAIFALYTGLTIQMLPNHANTTTTPTFNLCSLGAKTITKLGTAALANSDMLTTCIAVMIYDGTEWQLQNPQTGAVSGVSSFTGDSALLNNSASTGSVTATLANGGAHKFWGNNTGSSAAPGYQAVGSQDYSPNAYVAGGGTANAQTATYSPAITSLVAGLNACWLPTAPNSTTTPTFAPNGLTAATITKLGHTALVASDLTTTAVACAIYDGTDWQLQNPQTVSAGGSGNYVNITGTITPTNCTVTSGVCTTTGSVSSITLASIPGTYTSLHIVYLGTSSTLATIEIQFNGDTGTNYANEGINIQGNGSTVGNGFASQASFHAGLISTLVGGGTMDIPFYASANPKMLVMAAGAWGSVSSVTNNVYYGFTGLWNNTAAVTSIKLFPNSGTISTGTSFAIYGTN